MRCSGTNAKGQPCGWRGPLYPDGRCWHHTQHVSGDERHNTRMSALEQVRDAPEVGVDLEALRRQYGTQPEAFLRKVLGVRTLWSGQHRMIEAIRDSDRVAVVGANATSKTFTLAAALAWKLYTADPPPMIVVLSPIARQQTGQFWRELRLLLDGTELADVGEHYKAIDKGIEVGPNHKIFGFSTSVSTGTPEGRALGYHHPNLIIAIDQAESVEPWLWDAVLKSKPKQVIACGNPSAPSGFWYNLHRESPSNGWRSLTLSALDLIADPVHHEIPGAADSAWVFEVERTFGRDSPFFKSAVLGEFVHGVEENVLIPPRLWEQADELWRTERDRFEIEARRFLPVAGWDIAATAGVNAVAVVQGPLVLGIETWREPNLNESISSLREALRKFKLRKDWRAESRSDYGIIAGGWSQNFKLVVDSVGAGWGAASLLRDRGWEVISFMGSHAPDGRLDGSAVVSFNNARTESYWALRDALQRGELAVEYDDDLVAQGSVRFAEDIAGRLALEPKRDLSQRLGISSPDKLDALAMAVWWTRTRRPTAHGVAVHY